MSREDINVGIPLLSLVCTMSNPDDLQFYPFLMHVGTAGGAAHIQGRDKRARYVCQKRTWSTMLPGGSSFFVPILVKVLFGGIAPREA